MTTPAPRQPLSGLSRLLRGPPGGRFRLTQYFTLTSLVAFTLVAIALYFLEGAEQSFFESSQAEQGALFVRSQDELVREQKVAARGALLMQHESGHVALTRVSANALWDAHIAPLVAKAQAIPADRCGRAPPVDERPVAPSPERKACIAETGRRIQALPGFAAMDAAVHSMMRGTQVFKIKVYDLRGLTVYSSELSQIGEDKSDNGGWKSAVGGKPASELVHRDRFSAFEGEVDNRDLIQSYVPVLAADGIGVRGVFEIYSDVTTLLKEVDAAAERIGGIAAANRARVEQVARERQRMVRENSVGHFIILAGLFLALYLALLVLVRNGQRIIDEQARAREQAAMREQQWHAEKMAALATMAANASHEIGNPLAVIAAIADDISRAGPAGAAQGRMIHEQAARIAQMTREITAFATERSRSSEPIDVDEMVKAVCHFMGYDSRYRGTRIETRLAGRLPACIGIPEHLNEVLMSLLQAHAEACNRPPANGGRLEVRTKPQGLDVAIRIECECHEAGKDCAPDPADARLDSARRRMEEMGGRLVFEGTATEIHLACYPAG